LGGRVIAPVDIVNELRARGVELRVEGEQLRFRPTDRVTPELLARLREHKPALLAFLKPEPAEDRAIPAARREATRLGVLGRSANGNDFGPHWIIGDALARLPEPLQGLVMPHDGWTPQGWAVYLRYRGSRCGERQRDRAKLYGQAADLLDPGHGGAS